MLPSVMSSSYSHIHDPYRCLNPTFPAGISDNGYYNNSGYHGHVHHQYSVANGYHHHQRHVAMDAMMTSTTTDPDILGEYRTRGGGGGGGGGEDGAMSGAGCYFPGSAHLHHPAPHLHHHHHHRYLFPGSSVATERSSSSSFVDPSGCFGPGTGVGGLPGGPFVGMGGVVATGVGGLIGAGGKLRKGKDDKICGVCGDRALSYNFDAISCESCKAFFRRNAPKGLDYFKCPYDDRCRMDVSNRRFCKRCRLNKCFEIGMRKEYILSEEEKALKRQKIEANRYMRELAASKVPSQDEPTTRRHPDFNNGGASGVGFSDQLDVVEATSQTIALRPDDASAIDELVAAYRVSLDTHTERDCPRERASLADLVNIAELSMRRVIAMTKQIASFRVLPQEDQIQLLKTGSIELLILRSVITFDREKQHFLDPFDSEETRALKLEQLEMAEVGTGLFEDHMKFIRTLVVELRADETTLILLLVVSLFSPDRDNLVSKDYVSGQQERYCLLLKKYLESRYSAGLARVLFPRFIMKLTDIRSLNEEHGHVLLKLNPDGIQPLMKEVLDLCR